MARWAAVCASAVACMYLPTVHAFLGVPSLVVRRGTADWRALETPRNMHGPGAAMPRRTRCAAAALCMQTAPDKLPEPLQLIVKSASSTREEVDLFVGEDAGMFDWADEKMGALGERGWLTFFAAVGTILSALAVLWIYPATGYSDDFLSFLEDLTGGNSHLVTLIFGIIFPVRLMPFFPCTQQPSSTVAPFCHVITAYENTYIANMHANTRNDLQCCAQIMHSGLASLRPYGEKIVGARTWRVIFAWPSLCLAYSWITYFIAHAHDGIVLYDGAQIGWLHALAWCLNFVSFFFLYPSVFNLKEVAAVDIPKLHLWETGIIRITRHPQFVGQSMWSAAHLMMVGSSFNALTMALLVAHHAFACWNGDRRLQDQHGENFLRIKERTSILPFAAIADGRQKLPKDFYKELLRAPYALIAVGTLGAYFAHPYMQAGAALVKNTGLVDGGIFNSIL